MIAHPLEQGTPEWAQFRLTHYGASEAAVMLGISTKGTRSELLRLKYLGDSKQFCDWVRENILDYGHEVEALARPIFEGMINQELYPVTCSADLMPPWASYEMSASLDGLTMSGDIAFEHKQWNSALAAAVKSGTVPDEYIPQCQQILLVTGAEYLYFVVSDGTAQNMVYAVVMPDKGWQGRIMDGWQQFDKDLAAYQLPEAEKILAAEPVLALPAVSVQVSGTIAVVNNFPAFESAVRNFLVNDLIREPKTDQDFVNLDLQIKAMKDGREAIKLAKTRVFSQMEAVDQAVKTADMLDSLLQQNCSMAEKLLTSEKARRRDELIEAARKAMTAHGDALQAEIVGLRLDRNMPDFAGAIKGLKSLASMQEKLGVALANGKIAADQLASDLRAKLTWVKENADEHRALLADLQQLALKPLEDFTLAITVRVDNHKRAEAARLDAEREAIRKEEIARLEREAAELADKQVADQAEAERAAAAKIEQQDPAASAVAGKTPASVSLFQETARTVDSGVPIERTYVSSSPRLAADGPPTLRLGQINERLAPINLTADGLASLGFKHAATDKAAKLYHESSFPAMCRALILHLGEISSTQRKDVA